MNSNILSINKTSIAALFIVFFIIAGLWIPYLLFVAFAIQCVAIFLLKKHESFCLLFFIVPFALIYRYPSITLSFLTLVQAVMILVFMFKKKSTKANIFLLLLFVSAYFLTRMGGYYLAIPKLLVMYLTVIVFIENYEPEHGASYVDSFALGMILSSIAGMFKEKIPGMLKYYSDMNYEYIDGVETLRFSGLFNDPNYYSIALVSSMLILVFYKKFKGYSKAKFWVLFLLLSFLGLSTYSKSFFLIFACVLLVEMLLNIKNQNKTESTLEILAFLILLFLVLFGDLEIINKILFRFSTYQGVTTGRDVVWRRYWNVIVQDAKTILFGMGLDAPYVGKKAVHSLYIEMIYYSGIIGLLIFLFSWIKIVFSSHKNKIQPMNLLLFVVVFVMYAFLCGFLNYAFPFYMIFGWMFADIGIKENR